MKIWDSVYICRRGFKDCLHDRSKNDNFDFVKKDDLRLLHSLFLLVKLDREHTDRKCVLYYQVWTVVPLF